MDPYRYGPSVHCSICGGIGKAHAGDAGWVYTCSFVHVDPNTCREILAQKKKDLEAREAKLKEKEVVVNT